MKYLLTVFICILYFDSYSQKIIWQGCYPNDSMFGHNILWQNAGKIILTKDSNYIITGGLHFKLTSYEAMTLYKINKKGDIIWHRELFDTLDEKSIPYAYSGLAEDDTGIVITGRAGVRTGYDTLNKSYIYSEFPYLAKLNKDGKILWQMFYDDPKDSLSEAIDVIKYDKGYYILTIPVNKYPAANTSSSFSIIKTDRKGKPLFINEKFYYGRHVEVKNIIKQYDGTLIITANSDSFLGDIQKRYRDKSCIGGCHNACIIKTDSMGDLLWRKTIGGTNDDKIITITTTNDSGYILGGISSSNDYDFNANHGNNDGWLAKYKDSVIVWKKMYGGKYNEDITCIASNGSETYLVAGEGTSPDGDIKRDTVNQGRVWLYEIDNQGEMKWSSLYGAPDSVDFIYTYVKSVVFTKDKLITALTITDGCVKNDPWNNSPDEQHLWVFNTRVISTGLNEEKVIDRKLNLYPNPATSTLTLQLPANATKDYYISITDMSSREILQTRITDVTDNKVDVSSLNSGVYFIKATGSSRVFHAKFVKV